MVRVSVRQRDQVVRACYPRIPGRVDTLRRIGVGCGAGVPSIVMPATDDATPAP